MERYLEKHQHRGTWVSLALVAALAWAAPLARATPALPEDFTVEGRLFDAGGVPLNTSVDLKIEIVNEGQPSCVLYRELRPGVDVSSTNVSAQGVFSLRLGAVAPAYSSSTLTALFAPGALTGDGCATTANPGDHRLIHVSVKKSVDTAYEALSPDTRITSVPLAKVAENALSLQGLVPASLLVLNGSTSLQQTNFEYLFTDTNYGRLKALVDGGSAQYVSASPTAALNFNGQRVTQVGTPTAATDAATKGYADTRLLGSAANITSVGPMTGDGAVLHWDAAGNTWVAAQPNTSPTGVAGGDLTGTYPNPTVRQSAIDATKIADGAITAAKIGGNSAINRLLITDATTGASVGFGSCNVNEVYAWTNSGWACTTVGSLSPVTSVAGKTGAVTLNAADILGLGTAALKDSGVAAGQVVTLNATAQLPAVDGSQLVNVNATKLATRAVASTAPTAGQVLTWNAATAQWEPSVAATGSVRDVTGGTGLLGGNITAVGTLSVDVGVTANKIVQLDAAARLPAVDGSQLGNVNATKLATRALAATAPTAGQVLAWNTSSAQWEPTLPALGSVTNVTAGGGLLGGNITTSGTISVDAGVTANKILQLNSSAQIPAVDGSLLLNVNATKLATRALAATAPTAGQVLAWNTTTAQWEPTIAATGSVRNVSAGTGLTGGNITVTGTVAVDVGAGANKIPQLNSSAQLALANGTAGAPAHGFAADAQAGMFYANGLNFATTGTARLTITQNGLVGIGTTTPAYPLDVAGTARATTLCIAGDCRSSWPSAGGLGTITSVTSANADIAVSNPNSAPVLTLNSGTTADKIVKLNPSAQIPALDASLLYNLNATNLTSGTISSARLPAVTGDVTGNAGTFQTTLAKIVGTPLNIGSLATGNVLKFTGSAWINATLSSADISDGPFVKTSQLPASSCSAAQTLSYSSPTGAWACSTVAVDGTMFSSQTKNTVLAGPNGSNGVPSFRGLVSADLPSGTLSGAGSTGYVPYYTSATTLGNSLLFANSTQVGINSTTPSATLDVNGATKTRGITSVGDATIQGAASVSSNLTISGHTYSGGFLQTTYNNQTMPPANDGGLAVSWNKNNGMAEVDFWNTRKNPSYGFNFNARNGDGANDFATMVSIYGPNGMNVGSVNLTMDVFGGFRSVQNYYFSDRRLKHDIAPLVGSLETLNHVRGVSYYWNDPKLGAGEQIGLIAQEVEEIYPSVVTTGPEGLKAVDYAHLVGPIIEAIKELYTRFKITDAKVDTDHDRIQALETENAALKARLDAIERSLSHR